MWKIWTVDAITQPWNGLYIWVSPHLICIKELKTWDYYFVYISAHELLLSLYPSPWFGIFWEPGFQNCPNVPHDFWVIYNFSNFLQNKGIPHVSCWCHESTLKWPLHLTKWNVDRRLGITTFCVFQPMICGIDIWT